MALDTTAFANSIMSSMADSRDESKKAVVGLIKVEVLERELEFYTKAQAFTDAITAKIEANPNADPAQIAAWQQLIKKFS